VFEPFAADTDYFGRKEQMWMLEVDKETYPNGRFARVQDPDGNPIQLWQPA